MDNSMDSLINKGWEQMYKTLDREIPNQHSYLGIKNKYIYSIAAVFLLLPFTYISLNNDHILVKNNILVVNFNKNQNNTEIAKLAIKNTEYNNLKFVNAPELVDNELVYADLPESGRFDEKVTEKIDQLFAKVNSNRENPEIGINNCKSEKIETIDFKRLSNDYRLIKKAKHNNLSFSLNSINKDFSSVSGLDGGFNYTYAISEKLGVSAGIEHTLLTEEMNSDEEKFFYNYSSIDINDGSEDYVFVKPGSLNNKMYYLGIPVSLLYRVDKVAFSTGFKVSYLLSEKYPEMPDFGENFAEFRIIAFENPKFKNDREKFDYNLIFKLEYKLKEDISIFSKFNYSIKDVFNSQSKSKYDPYYPVAQSRLAVPNSNSKDYYFGFGIKYDLINK
jgi:hypothetical protein